MAAEGRPRLRAAVGGASTISVTLTRARGARRRFQIAVSFFRFSGATPALPRLAALAAAGAGGGAQSRPSYAVAAEGRPRLRAAVGELCVVLSLSDFRLARSSSLSIGGGSRGGAANPVRAVAGAGAVIFCDWVGGRLSSGVSVAATGLRRAGEGFSASTIFGNLTRARGARCRFQIAVSFFGFSSATESTAPSSDGAGRADCAAGAAAELRRHRCWLPLPPLRRRGAPACSRSRFSGWISGWRGGALYPLAVAADRRRRFSNNSKQGDC